MTMRDLVSGVQAPSSIRSGSSGGDRRPHFFVAPGVVLVAVIGCAALLAIALAWMVPLPAVRPLPPLSLPAAALQARSPSDLAASASEIVLARPLFAITRRPVAAPADRSLDRAGADRISGIILEPDGEGAENAVAVMQPKDGSKPVTLRVGDRFRGETITAIDAGGVTLAGGVRVAPQFGPAAAR